MMKAMFRGKGKCVDFSSFEFLLETKRIGIILINYVDDDIVTVNMKFA